MTMAYSSSTISSVRQHFPLYRVRAVSTASCKAQASQRAQLNVPTAAQQGRRQLLFSLTASTALISTLQPSKAQDIPLFGLRKSLKKVEEEAEVIVKEGFEAADKGLETAEKGIEAAEKGIVAAEKGLESAEKGIELAVSFGGLAQAGVVAGAEFVGVLVANGVVNFILGPEAQKT